MNMSSECGLYTRQLRSNDRRQVSWLLDQICRKLLRRLFPSRAELALEALAILRIKLVRLRKQHPCSPFQLKRLRRPRRHCLHVRLTLTASESMSRFFCAMARTTSFLNSLWQRLLSTSVGLRFWCGDNLPIECCSAGGKPRLPDIFDIG